MMYINTTYEKFVTLKVRYKENEILRQLKKISLKIIQLTHCQYLKVECLVSQSDFSWPCHVIFPFKNWLLSARTKAENFFLGKLGYVLKLIVRLSAFMHSTNLEKTKKCQHLVLLEPKMNIKVSFLPNKTQT